MTETVERLLTEHLDTWTAAVETKSAAGRGSSKKLKLVGVAKLRELILELAVRGQLVPQDESDEPASVLLERIAVERERLVQEKKIKKPKVLAEISEGEKPFGLPVGWEWVRLSEVGHDFGQKIPNNLFTYIDVGSINKELGYVFEPNILEPSEAPSRARKIVKNGTVIYSTVRPYLLNIAIVDTDFNPEPIASTAFAIIHPFSGIYASFLYRYLRSPAFISYVESCQTGVAYPAINDKQFFNGVFPVAPTLEQSRIVDKVDELMALCDALEQEQESSIAAHGLLVENLLAALTNAASQGEFKQAWARVAAHFDMLFTTEQSVEQLKQTILQLAVMGKLVEQDAADEPAGVLLERIAAEKARLVEEKVIKKQKVLPEISDEEKVFELPEGWSWFSLSELGVFSGGKTPSKMNKDFWDGDIPWVTPKDMKVSKIYDSLDHVTNKAIESGLALFPEDALLFVVRSGILQHSFPVAITKKQCTVNQDLKVLTLIDTSLVDYVFLMMKGFEQYIIENLTKTGTTVESIQFERFSPHFFMLPPKNEQERILNLVSELVDILNKLKSNVILTRKTQLLLADVLKDQTKF